ncbi:efflux RND transporter periplasmic adaptor subunit [Pendulispora brunnea]|uniref:Efflux RND transporter periplasmic adaptor subunit n=1 Tax=Pendulispora brunnea TaxID=2905690 RepID=A0ABZ2KCZ5_9BACT
MRRVRFSPFKFALLLCGASSVLFAACKRGEQATPEGTAPVPTVEHHNGKVFVPEGSPLRQRIEVKPAEMKSIERHIVAPSTVEAEPTRLAKIAPPLAGRIVKLFVHFGDSVKAGAPLFTIDSPDLVAAQSDYLKAKSAFAQAERDVARQKDLVDHGIGAQKELEQAQTDRETAKSELERTTTRLHLLGVGPGNVGGPMTVRSPIAGRVIDLSTAPGQFQNDPASILMIVADLSNVWVTANIQEKDIRRVHQGDDAVATFTAYPGESFPGKVAFVGDLLDAETRTIKVRIGFDNPDSRLKPAMFATVSFHGKAVPELVVPVASVVIASDKSHVFFETGPWEFERRPVTVGDQVGDQFIVVKGIEAGQRIVTANAVLLP